MKLVDFFDEIVQNMVIGHKMSNGAESVKMESAFWCFCQLLGSKEASSVLPLLDRESRYDIVHFVKKLRESLKFQAGKSKSQKTRFKNREI